MSNYIFEKVGTVYLNGKKVNEYNVYKTEIEEVSEIREECERPGVTVVTSQSKIIHRNASHDIKVFAGKVFGKTKKEAMENYFEESY
jgi:hypothetical protein